MTSPVPGLVYPAPRTWTAGDPITTPRLRGDLTNLAALYTSGRPLMYGIGSIGNGVSGITNIGFDITYGNNWNVPVVNSGGTNVFYDIPMAGWWLIQGQFGVQPPASNPQNDRYMAGFNVVINGAASLQFNGGGNPAGTSTAGAAITGMCAAELIQLNPFTNDTVAWFAYCSAATLLWSGMMQAEWIALPTSGLSSYPGPYGTVVAAPQAPSPFPPGPGTTLTAGMVPGATFADVTSNTGIVVGGTLGLGYINGQQAQPYAEAVTVTSVSGGSIGISASLYGHSTGDPVAVPVSAAFLNQQVRDEINFLSYPPIVRAISNATQSIASGTFPNGVQITTLGTETVDNFSQFASSTFTAALAGLYYVYGQVSLAGSTAVFSVAAGISVNGGTVQWGTLARSDTTGGAQITCPAVCRHVRLTAGQTITLFAYQNSGSAMSTNNTTGDKSKLIVIWRAV